MKIDDPQLDATNFDPTDYHTGTYGTPDYGRKELRYVVIPSAWPSPGDEVVVNGSRIPIISISEVTNKTDTQVVLELERELSLSVGKDFTFHVVTPGGDPYSVYFSDDAPRDGDGFTLDDGFLGSSVNILGREIQYSGRSTQRRKIVEVMDSSTIRLASKVPYESSGIGYRIISGTTGNTDRLGKIGSIGDVQLTAAQAGDYLTVWSDPSVGTVSNSSQVPLNPKGIGWLTFSPKITSDRESLYFTTITGGSKDYGRYLLLNYLNDTLSIDDTIDTLTLHVAEVIHKHGEILTTVSKVPPGDVGGVVAGAEGDGDGDTDTSILHMGYLPAVDADFVGFVQTLKIGDKVTLTYTVEVAEFAEVPVFTQSTYITFVPEADSDAFNTILIYPEVPITTAAESGEADLYTTPDTRPSQVDVGIPYRITDWKIERTPISFALLEAAKLKVQVQALQDLVDNYTVDISDAVGSVLEVLSENSMDRAVELLLDGKMKEFFGMGASDASFAAAAKAAIQTAGRILVETDDG